MVLVLVVGDLHIPMRASSIPEPFRKMFSPGRVQTVLITGNIGSQEMYDYFKTLTPDVYATRGEFDTWGKALPDTEVLDVEDLKIGLIHGHQVVPCGDKDSLAMVQRKLDVDVLISGGTHANRTFEFDGHLFINPGSITGAFTPFESDVPATFVLLDIKGKSVTSFSYQFVPDGEEELKIKKKTWTKEI